MDTAGPGMMDMDIPLNFMDIALASGRYDSMTLFMTHLGLIDRHWEPLSIGLIARAKKYPHILIALSRYYEDIADHTVDTNERSIRSIVNEIVKIVDSDH